MGNAVRASKLFRGFGQDNSALAMFWESTMGCGKQCSEQIRMESLVVCIGKLMGSVSGDEDFSIARSQNQ